MKRDELAIRGERALHVVAHRLRREVDRASAASPQEIQVAAALRTGGIEHLPTIGRDVRVDLRSWCFRQLPERRDRRWVHGSWRPPPRADPAENYTCDTDGDPR